MKDVLKAEDVQGPLEVGRTYLVPCLCMDSGLGWMPVVPWVHHDREIGEPRHHVHYDYRFMTTESKDRLVARNGPQVVPVVYVPEKVEYDRREMVCVSPTNHTDPCNLIQRGVRFVEGLDDLCRDKTFNGKVCPHKGYPLEGVRPNSKGVVTCPLHGTRWNKNGTYAGTKTIQEGFLEHYMKDVIPLQRDVKVGLYVNEVPPNPNVMLSDLREPVLYKPVILRDVIYRTEPRPRVIADNMEIAIVINEEVTIYGFFIAAAGWDRPLWMERFRQDCTPTSFSIPKSGGTITIKLLDD